jgi:hypothetical protein
LVVPDDFTGVIAGIVMDLVAISTVKLMNRALDPLLLYLWPLTDLQNVAILLIRPAAGSAGYNQVLFDEERVWQSVSSRRSWVLAQRIISTVTAALTAAGT